MAEIEHIRVYPVKGLDGIGIEETEILPGGTLAHDRAYALFDENGEVINGKRTARVHELQADFDPEREVLAVETPAGRQASFDLPAEVDRASEWFSDVFDQSLDMQRDGSLGFVDRREMGPSVISTATLERVASWFDDMTVEGARRRLRANVEVSDVPAFWEDRFVGEDAPAFRAGDVRFEGVTPCGRCVVPQRDPDTGEALPEFQKRFVEKRQETFPEWADRDAFDHYFTLMLIARVPEPDREQRLAVGDSVEVLGA